eukprot:CAMPEP_0176050722 /NCGR_PEP_ID=MMETSP0120_2-20121206/25212_1 /TAXON_ID=160619 /ORGANISM="Kryptoperidinium foliaceum, Strain CCMP 1326" /LENGTH=250 /DNA_ID=CAMNT_0017384157 /DNA_START=14 /DNA_END=766 /DNA_ORIENTATION=+
MAGRSVTSTPRLACERAHSVSRALAVVLRRGARDQDESAISDEPLLAADGCERISRRPTPPTFAASQRCAPSGASEAAGADPTKDLEETPKGQSPAATTLMDAKASAAPEIAHSGRRLPIVPSRGRERCDEDGFLDMRRALRQPSRTPSPPAGKSRESCQQIMDSVAIASAAAHRFQQMQQLQREQRAERLKAWPGKEETIEEEQRGAAEDLQVTIAWQVSRTRSASRSPSPAARECRLCTALKTSMMWR